MFHHLYGTPVVIVRIFMVYGPRQPAQKVIPYTILSLLNQQRPKLSSAERLIDWIYIDDVIAGFLAAARAAGIEGQTVDLGSGLLVSVRDVVERLVSSINPGLRPLYGALPTRPGELIRAANIAGTAQRIGWRATTPLAEGLESTVRWYRSQLNQNACTQTAPLERPQSASDKSYDGPEPASRS
jgi:nucleoside-diphosphate-sugar epimerase